MGLKFRRGSTAQQSGSLAFGEPYVNTTLGTLVVGGATGDIVLSAAGTGSTGNFGAISGSGLDITGNANIAGNLTLGGQLTIGDNTSDTVNVVASLSSSLIPQTTNVFDLGSPTKFWRDLYISTGSIKMMDSAGNVISTLSAAASGMAFDGDIYVAQSGSSPVTVGKGGGFKLGNTALGVTALSSNTTGNNNTALGATAGAFNSTGGDNTVVGRAAGYMNQTGAGNTAVGAETLFANNGAGNVVVGYGGLKQTATGGFNIALGYLAGQYAISGSSNNILIGYSAGPEAPAVINQELYIGVNGDSALLRGNFVESRLKINGELQVRDNLVVSGSIISAQMDAIGVSTSSLNSFTSSVGGRLTNLESTTASLNTSVSNLNSFTSSIDTTIKTKLDADGVISSSAQLTTTFDSRYLNTEADSVVSGSSQIDLTATTNYASGILTRLNAVGVFSGSSQVSLGSASGNIALATQTTGNYVASLVEGTGVTITNNSGENATPTIAIGQAVATSSNVQFNSLGIGMAASATAGRIDATNDIVAFSSSDIRFKENITPIENALDKISKISGNTYDWKAENKIEHGYEGNDVGVIAQEIEAVLPQLVQTRENGFKAVKYDKLVALLIQGIKEQQLQIEELKAKIGL